MGHQGRECLVAGHWATTDVEGLGLHPLRLSTRSGFCFVSGGGGGWGVLGVAGGLNFRVRGQLVWGAIIFYLKNIIILLLLSCRKDTRGPWLKPRLRWTRLRDTLKCKSETSPVFPSSVTDP